MDTSAAEPIIVSTLSSHSEVRLAYLFGSRVGGNIGPLSDYDVAVLLEDDAVTFEAGFNLAHELIMVLDAEVDLVVLNQAPIVLAYPVIAQGRRLLERDVATRVECEAHILSLYGDYLPVLRQQRHDLLYGDSDAARICRDRNASQRIDDTLASPRAAADKEPRGEPAQPVALAGQCRHGVAVGAEAVIDRCQLAQHFAAQFLAR